MLEGGPEGVEGFFYCSSRPDWFAPGDPGRYRIWISQRSDSLVLQDLTDEDHTFIYGCQL